MLPREFVRTHGLNLPLFVIINDQGELLYFHNRKLDDQSAAELVTAALASR